MLHNVKQKIVKLFLVVLDKLFEVVSFLLLGLAHINRRLFLKNELTEMYLENVVVVLCKCN